MTEEISLIQWLEKILPMFEEIPVPEGFNRTISTKTGDKEGESYVEIIFSIDEEKTKPEVGF